MDINQVLLNPIRGRLIQHLASQHEATAGDLALLMTDIPRTTLYRHIKTLLEHEVVRVVAEKRVRGSLERTYALNIGTLSRHNTPDNMLQNTFGFLMQIYADFAQYLQGDRVDPAADGLFLTHRSLLLDDEEFKELMQGIGEMLLQHQGNKLRNGRRPRSLSLVSSPVINDEEGARDDKKRQAEE